MRLLEAVLREASWCSRHRPATAGQHLPQTRTSDEVPLMSSSRGWVLAATSAHRCRECCDRGNADRPQRTYAKAAVADRSRARMPIRTASRKQRSFPRTMSPFKMPWRDVELPALRLLRMADKRRKASPCLPCTVSRTWPRTACRCHAWMAGTRGVCSPHWWEGRSSNDAPLKNWR